jgi:hypothetical protein
MIGRNALLVNSNGHYVMSPFRALCSFRRLLAFVVATLWRRQKVP